MSKLYRYSIHRRLITCFVYVFVLPILIVGGYKAAYSFDKNQRDARVFLEESSAQIANNISNYLFDHTRLLDVVALNPEIISDLDDYDQVDWGQKSEIENHIRLVLGNTFGASGAINTCEITSVYKTFFYYPSPISNGDFNGSNLLSTEARRVKMSISAKEVSTDSSAYVILTRGIYNKDDICIANIVAALDLTYINKACYENVSNLHNEVFIMNQDNQIVSASHEELIGTTFSESKKRYISISKNIPNTTLTIVNQMEINTLLKSAQVQLSIALLMAILLAVLALILAFLFTQSITRPINQLMDEMNQPDVNKYVEDNGEDEYHSVIIGFNKISGHIVATTQRQYNLQMQQTELRSLRKEAELSALQQQINPHFLYNTLESIYWNGQLEGDDEISEIVSALGHYLRAIIDKGRAYVTIETEIESVNNYIFLQNIRFGNRISNQWDVPKTIKNTRILKLALHPIVEDVIATNLDEIEAEINMSIAIKVVNEDVFVRMTGEAVAYFIDGVVDGSFNMKGLTSVNERLSLHYGTNYGIELSTDEGCISVHMPIYYDVNDGGDAS